MADSEFTFGVYIISCNRFSRGMVTALNFTDAKHVVRKSQESDYISAGFTNVIAVDDELIDGYCSAYNYVVENTPEDVVAIVDDDIRSFTYRLDTSYAISSPETVQAEFERLAQIIHDLDIGVAFGPATPVPYGYTSEFGFFGIPGAFKIVNKKCVKSSMNEEFIRNCDIDYVLSELLDNRICLNAKYLCDMPMEDTITNTSGSSYTLSDIYASVDMMKNKWGKYFSYNYKKNVPKITVKR